MKRFKLFLKMLYLGILGLLSFVLLSCGAFLLFLRTQYMLPVLTYHRVVPWAHKHGPLLVSPESFRRQMSFFQRNHYHVLSLREAAPYIASSRFPPPRSVVITFDDGYDDNFIYAFPILKKYGFPATIFMVAGEVGKPNFLNWEQLREMTYHGIAIGSHTITHCYLPRESRERMREEIFNSKKILEDELGGEVVSFCYPVG